MPILGQPLGAWLTARLTQNGFITVRSPGRKAGMLGPPERQVQTLLPETQLFVLSASAPLPCTPGCSCGPVAELACRRPGAGQLPQGSEAQPHMAGDAGQPGLCAQRPTSVTVSSCFSICPLLRSQPPLGRLTSFRTSRQGKCAFQDSAGFRGRKPISLDSVPVGSPGAPGHLRSSARSTVPLRQPHSLAGWATPG